MLRTLPRKNPLGTEQKQAAEQERQQIEVLAHQLASASRGCRNFDGSRYSLTDARTEAEKALQAAQASAAEQKLALEQERQRGDALVRDLASAREEAEARKAAANAADASGKAASATEQKQAAEQERQQTERSARISWHRLERDVSGLPRRRLALQAHDRCAGLTGRSKKQLQSCSGFGR